jgi:hypothetical protein
LPAAALTNPVRPERSGTQSREVEGRPLRTRFAFANPRSQPKRFGFGIMQASKRSEPMSQGFEELTAIFRKLGANDPEGWASSQVQEGIPQLARFVFLKQAWSLVLADDDTRWIAPSVESALKRPDEPYASVGLALQRLLSAGADPRDLTDVVRGMQAELLFNLCYLLGDPGFPNPIADVAWGLFQLNDDDQPVVHIGGLHESVLETDPTGREMRPRTDSQ